MTTPLVMNIDASSLSSADCLRKYWNNYVLCVDRSSGVTYNDTQYGNAMHIFWESLALTKNPMISMSTANSYFAGQRLKGMVFKEKKEWLDESHLSAIMMRYVQEFDITKSWGKYEYICDKEGKPLVEQTFSILFYETSTLKVYLQGTQDELVLAKEGYAVQQDFKTASNYQSWVWNNHETKPQMKFYRLSLSLLAEQEEGEWFKELLARRVGSRINGLKIVKEPKECEFGQSSIFFYEDEQLNAFRIWLNYICAMLDKYIQEGNPPPPSGLFTDSCNGKYGPCPYLNACKTPRNSIYESMINNMPRSSYEPLNFRKR
jgi:hypothetical protein